MIIVTSMGRLQHLQKTLPLMLQHDHVTLVDWSCPDGSGEWATRSFPTEIRTGRLSVSRIEGARSFHKSAALNHGARWATKNRAEHSVSLLFLDSDTTIETGFDRWYPVARQELDCFHICLRPKGHVASWDYTGILLVSSAAFSQSGGYCEQIRSWGMEDIDLRLALAIRAKIPWKDIPLGIFKAIPHSDLLRVRNYSIKDKNVSNRQNARILKQNVQRWTGRPFRELPNTYTPLLSQP